MSALGSGFASKQNGLDKVLLFLLLLQHCVTMTAGKDNVIGIDCCMTINQQSATNIYPPNQGVWLEAVVKSADYEYETSTITQKE